MNSPPTILRTTIVPLGIKSAATFLLIISSLNAAPKEYLEVLFFIKFAGYKKFGGDQTLPLKVTRQYTGLIAHYAIRVQAKIYKIDSWIN
jgi:hypothetical protein